jgi:hypothetical protein
MNSIPFYFCFFQHWNTQFIQMKETRVHDSFGNSILLHEKQINDLLYFSLHFRNIFEIQNETDDESIDVYLDNEFSIQIFEYLIQLIQFQHQPDDILFFATLDMAQHSLSITKLMDFFMFDPSLREEVNNILDDYKNCTWKELFESEDLETTFLNAYFHIQPRTHVLSFQVFMNTFVKHYGSYSMDFFYRFLRVYNDYVYRMKNLGYGIFEKDVGIFPYQLEKIYTPEVFEIYQKLLFPKEIFCFMDDNYSPFQKIFELVETPYDTDVIRDMHEFMHSTEQHHNVYFCGSSILYFLLRDYDKSNVNDIDIWLNSSHHENHVTQFMKRFTKKISPHSTKNIIVERSGILDVKPENAKIGLQYIHVQHKSAFDVIQHFDLPCVSAYYQCENKCENIYLTSHFIESILQRKIFDFHNWRSVFRTNLYKVQKRLLKYQERGFELTPHLLTKLEKIQRPCDMETNTIETHRGEIPYFVLNRFRRTYFNFDFEFYYDGTQKIRDYDSFIFLRNKHIFDDHFQKFLPKEKDRFGSTYFDNHTLQYIDKLKLNSHFINIFTIFCFIDFHSGLPIEIDIQSTENFPIQDFKSKYDIHHIDISNDFIYITKKSQHASVSKPRVFADDTW